MMCTWVSISRVLFDFLSTGNHCWRRVAVGQEDSLFTPTESVYDLRSHVKSAVIKANYLKDSLSRLKWK